jgi:hypothetical protein
MFPLKSTLFASEIDILALLVLSHYSLKPQPVDLKQYKPNQTVTTNIPRITHAPNTKKKKKKFENIELMIVIIA